TAMADSSDTCDVPGAHRDVCPASEKRGAGSDCRVRQCLYDIHGGSAWFRPENRRSVRPIGNRKPQSSLIMGTSPDRGHGGDQSTWRSTQSSTSVVSTNIWFVVSVAGVLS